MNLMKADAEIATLEMATPDGQRDRIPGGECEPDCELGSGACRATRSSPFWSLKARQRLSDLSKHAKESRY